jgi:hypothetical protein
VKIFFFLSRRWIYEMVVRTKTMKVKNVWTVITSGGWVHRQPLVC